MPSGLGPSGLDGPVALNPPLTVGSIYDTEVLADSPLGFWKLNDTASPIADASGNGLTGTFGSGVTPGAAGLATDNESAMTFDGISGTVDLGVPASLVGAVNAWSLEVLVNLTSVPNRTGFITRHYSGGSVQYELGLGVDGAGNKKLTGGFFTGGAWKVVRDSVIAVAATLYHAVVTWDGTTLKLYKGGVLIASSTPGVSDTAGNAGDHIFLGQQHDGVGFFPGIMGKAALYGTALSAARVLAHTRASLAAVTVTPLTDPVGPVVHLSGTETITGAKTFTSPIGGSLAALTLDDGGEVYNLKHPTIGGVGDGATLNDAAFTNLANAILGSAEGNGGVGYIPSGNFKKATSHVLQGCYLRGAGRGRAIVSASQSLGAAIPILELTHSAQFEATNTGASDFELVGFGTTPLGGPIQNYGDGLKLDYAMLIERVASYNFDNAFVANAANGHIMLNFCSGTGLYGLYVLQDNGDHCYFESGFSGGLASIAYPGTQGAGGTAFLRVHRGFSPIGTYQEASGSPSAFLNGIAIAGVCEAAGNADHLSENFASITGGGMYGYEYHNKIFSWSATYNAPARLRDYTWKLGYCTNSNQIYDLQGGSPGPLLDADVGTFYSPKLDNVIDWWHGKSEFGEATQIPTRAPTFFFNSSGGNGGIRMHPADGRNRSGTGTIAAATSSLATGAGAGYAGPTISPKVWLTGLGGEAVPFGVYVSNVLTSPPLHAPGSVTSGSPTATSPPLAVLAGLGAGNIDNGTHAYAITAVWQSGETMAGPNSTALTVADKTVNGQASVTLPTVATPTGVSAVTFNLYRSQAGVSNPSRTQLFQVATGLANGAVYTDNSSDATIGVNPNPPSTNGSGASLFTVNLIPPIPSALTAAMGSTGVTSITPLVALPYSLPSGTKISLGWGTANVEVVTTSGVTNAGATAITITAGTTKTHAQNDPIAILPSSGLTFSWELMY